MIHHCTNCFNTWHIGLVRAGCLPSLPRVGRLLVHPTNVDVACSSSAGGALSTPPHDCPVFICVEAGIREGSVQLCLFANRLLYPTRKAIWIRTACLAAAQRFSLKPAGNRWINRTQRYRLNPCKLLILPVGWDIRNSNCPTAFGHTPLLVSYPPDISLVSYSKHQYLCL